MKTRRKSKIKQSHRLFLWKQRLELLASGGRWSSHVPPKPRASLRWFLIDGVFANAGNSVIRTYQAIYLQALGASRGEIGLLSAIINLMMPLAMLPGALLARGKQQRKRVVLLLASLSRLMLFGLVFLPYFSTRFRLISLGIGFFALYYFFSALLNPAWTAIVGAIVPARWRGRYFSTRNIAIGIVTFVVGLALGWVIDFFGRPQGYQIAFGLAIVTGFISIYAFSHVIEPPLKRSAKVAVQGTFWSNLKGKNVFLGVCVTAALWNFGVQVSSPFFFVYLVDETQATATVIGLLTAVSSLAALPGQRIFGIWNDHKGSRWVQRLTGLLIPLVPLLWGFITQSWQAFPLNLLSNFVWAGYHLASFNLLLETTPQENRPAFVAFYQTFVGLGMVGGAALGALVAQRQGYRAVFMLSAALRFLSALAFALVVARSKPLPKFKFPKVSLRKRKKK